MPNRAVFLDMDGTVTPNTGRVMAETLWRKGHLPLRRMAGIWLLLARYKVGLVRMEKIMEGWIEREAGKPVQPVEALCRELAEQVVIPTLFEEARSAIRQHQEKGECVALLSASSLHMIEPIAEALGVEFTPWEPVCTYGTECTRGPTTIRCATERVKFIGHRSFVIPRAWLWKILRFTRTASRTSRCWNG